MRRVSIWEEYGELVGGFLRFWDEVEVEVVVVFDVDVVESEEGMGEDSREEVVERWSGVRWRWKV